MSTFSFQLPALSALSNLSQEMQLRKIRGYLYQLTEQLRYTLGNLDTENLTPAAAKKLDGAANKDAVDASLEQSFAKSERQYKEALSQIIAAADAVTAAYSAEMNVLSDRIQSDVEARYALKSDVEQSALSISSRVTQNAGDITAAFTRVLQLEDAVGSFRQETFSTFIRFDAGGVELGRTDSEFRCRLTNERLSFLQGANEVAFISNNRLYITDAVVTGTLSLGHTGVGFYDFQREANGSLSLVYRGANESF